jgi:hypothetical protein
VPRFEVVTHTEAAKRGWFTGLSENDTCYVLYDTATDPPTYVADDAMQPEDANLLRDLSWVPVTLNQLADQIQQRDVTAVRQASLLHLALRQMRVWREREPKQTPGELDVAVRSIETVLLSMMTPHTIVVSEQEMAALEAALSHSAAAPRVGLAVDANCARCGAAYGVHGLDNGCPDRTGSFTPEGVQQ